MTGYRPDGAMGVRTVDEMRLLGVGTARPFGGVMHGCVVLVREAGDVKERVYGMDGSATRFADDANDTTYDAEWTRAGDDSAKAGSVVESKALRKKSESVLNRPWRAPRGRWDICARWTASGGDRPRGTCTC